MIKLKPTIILVEGPDNVGKTTLIRNLKNYFNSNTFSTVHFSHVRQESKKSYESYSYNLYRNMFKLAEYHVKELNSCMICDRSHIGEMIYAPLYRNYDGDYVRRLEEQCEVLNNFVLFTLVGKPKSLKDREDGLSLSNGELNLIIEETKNFKDATKKSYIKNKYIIDTNKRNETEVFMRAITILEAINAQD